MKTMIMMVVLCAMACAVAPAISSEMQDFQTCCTPDEDNNYCSGQAVCDGGGLGGGGWVNRCTWPVACDPTFGYTSDLNCITSCAAASARCYHTYRCGNDPACPEAHIGYCGVF
jgi:hypothetical protein